MINENFKPPFQQRNSALFTVRSDAQDTYDAFEKDIAIASFYFEEPTAYEYSRYAMTIDTWYVFINIKLPFFVNNFLLLS